MRNQKNRTRVWVWEEWKRRWRREKKKCVQRVRGGENAESGIPGIGFAVIFSRYNVFEQLATGDPIGKSKKSVTNCN